MDTHYTNSANATNIDVNGLRRSADGYTYTTTEPNYTSDEAINALNLDPAGGARDAVYQIDVNSLISNGIVPVNGLTPVVGGSGFEVKFNQPIPAKYLIRIK